MSLVRSVGEVPRCTLRGTTGWTVITTLYSTWRNCDYHVVLYVAQPEGYPSYYHVVLNVVQLSTTLYSTWYNCLPRCTQRGTTGRTAIATLQSTLYFVATTLYSTLRNRRVTPHTTLFSTWHNRTDHVILYVVQPDGL